MVALVSAAILAGALVLAGLGVGQTMHVDMGQTESVSHLEYRPPPE